MSNIATDIKNIYEESTNSGVSEFLEGLIEVNIKKNTDADKYMNIAEEFTYDDLKDVIKELKSLKILSNPVMELISTKAKEEYIKRITAIAEEHASVELYGLPSEEDFRDRFENEVLPYVVEQYGEDDEAAINEAFNNWTDMLCKDGEMTEEQYSNYTREGTYDGDAEEQMKARFIKEKLDEFNIPEKKSSSNKNTSKPTM